MTFALTVRDNEKSERTVMRRLINRRSGTGESTEFTRQPDNRVGVRRLRALDAYRVRADRLRISDDVPFAYYGSDCRDRITEDDVRQAQRLADMMLVYRAVNKLTSRQKLLLYAIYTTKDTSQTTIYACYNRLISDGMNGSKLTTKWLSILAQELELLGFVDIHQKGRDAGAEPILRFSHRGRFTASIWSRR